MILCKACLFKFLFQTHITHNNYSRKCNVTTPNRKKTIASLSRRNYRAAATAFVNVELAKPHMIAQVAKFIQEEMKRICSLEHNSILRSQHDQIKSFNWESILTEFEQNVPTLILLLRHLMPKADGKLLSFIVAIILKRRCKHMSLVQRVISVMLYGNTAQKEVGVLVIKTTLYYLLFRFTSVYSPIWFACLLVLQQL